MTGGFGLRILWVLVALSSVVATSEAGCYPCGLDRSVEEETKIINIFEVKKIAEKIIHPSCAGTQTRFWTVLPPWRRYELRTRLILLANFSNMFLTLWKLLMA